MAESSNTGPASLNGRGTDPRNVSADRARRSFVEDDSDYGVPTALGDQYADSGELGSGEFPTSSSGLRQAVKDFYTPAHLIEAIEDNGFIPQEATEESAAVASVNVVDYSHLSRFLSPAENQAVLNGLHTAFYVLLQESGGYLNKVDGDTMVFHYGGQLDPNTRFAGDDAARRLMARKLFDTCVEMHRITRMFDQADERFLELSAGPEQYETLQRAFQVIAELRHNQHLAVSAYGAFHVQIRIGAAIGPVTNGNFGPTGAKHWDIVGAPVIEARNMERTAPSGGLRMTEELYQVLDRMNVPEEYTHSFRDEAAAEAGRFQRVRRDEVFRFARVTPPEKHATELRSYSVLVDPLLPERIGRRVDVLLVCGASEAERILDYIAYYRGHRHVIDETEEVFRRRGVQLRKLAMLRAMYPRKIAKLSRLSCRQGSEGAPETEASQAQEKDAAGQRRDGDGDASGEQYRSSHTIPSHLEHEIDRRHSLFEILSRLGSYQDLVKLPAGRHAVAPEHKLDELNDDFDRRAEELLKELKQRYSECRRTLAKEAYFYHVMYPFVFEALRASVREYQEQVGELEAV